MVVTYILWLITFGLGIWDLFLLWQVALRTYSRFVPTGAGYALANILIIIPLVIAGIAVTIGSAEYHRLRWGTPESWQLFARVFAIEFAILALPIFL